jgi:outer membrane protein OmpA-like peptidoglycan-associated protein
MKGAVGAAALVASVWMATVFVKAQEQEIYIGPSPDTFIDTPPQPTNYLAKCLADPADKFSCAIAQTAQTDGGLESAIQGQFGAASYIPCEKTGGVCLELATLDLGDDHEPHRTDKLSSVDVTILFEYGSSTIRKTEDAKLAQLANALKDLLNASASFGIIGHTDSKGRDDYNCRLSLERARAVTKRFETLGISSSRLVTIGAGEYLLHNEADGEASENRRVGLTRLKKPAGIVIDRLTKLCKN